MRAWLLAVLLAAPAAARTPEPIVALRYTVTRVDVVEREFWGKGQKRPVIGVFSTVYKVKGKRVPADVFWRNLSPGDQVDAKVRLHELFAIAVAGNLSVDTP